MTTEKPYRRMGELVIPIPKNEELDEEILKVIDGMTDGKEVFNTITKLARQQGAKAERERIINEIICIKNKVGKSNDMWESGRNSALEVIIWELRKGERK